MVKIKRRPLSELEDYIGGLKSVTRRAGALSILEVATNTRKEAIKNVRNTFGKDSDKPWSGRRQTGGLINSIFSSWDITWVSNKIRAFIGTRGIPYGRIHELGGTIRPKRARNLWIRLKDAHSGRFKRMTPTEFMQAKLDKNKRKNYFFVPTKTGSIATYKLGNVSKALFMLVKRVQMPKREYLRPAIKTAMASYPKIYKKHLKAESGKK